MKKEFYEKEIDRMILSIKHIIGYVSDNLEKYNNKIDYLVNLNDDRYSIININRSRILDFNKEDGWYLDICPNGIEHDKFPMGFQYVIKNGELFDYHILTLKEFHDCLFYFGDMLISKNL